MSAVGAIAMFSVLSCGDAETIRGVWVGERISGRVVGERTWQLSASRVLRMSQRQIAVTISFDQRPGSRGTGVTTGTQRSAPAVLEEVAANGAVAEGPSTIGQPSAIYLDYAATTPTEPEVARVMAGFLTRDGVFGNPHATVHAFGQAASEAVAAARREVAGLVGSHDDEIVWTSGATESVNLALKGVLMAASTRNRGLLVSALEHRAVLDTAAWLGRNRIRVDYVHPDPNGLITADGVEAQLRSDTALVSVMHVNNETGTVSDIGEIARVVHANGSLLHVDAAQSAARLPLDVRALGPDLLSLSGHKIYGPKGVGALFVRRGIRSTLEAQIHGGGQEGGHRSGTLATHQVAGLGVAARLTQAQLRTDMERIRALDRRLCGWLEGIGGVRFNGNRKERVPGILSVVVNGVEAESLMLGLEDIAISAGSACTTEEVVPSHVLIGLGVSEADALCSVRISIGRFTTEADIDAAGRRLRDTVVALRRISA